MRRTSGARDAPTNPFMTVLAIARVHSCRVRLMAQNAVLGHSSVGRAGMEGHLARVGVALRVGAGTHRVHRFGLGMRVVAHAAGSIVRITIDRELGELLRHRVAAQALLEIGP